MPTILKNVDLLICIDSAIAHLAGALGVPVWLVLPVAPDWRWMRNRDDSPWYPTMRLFRQKYRFDWDDVFLRMAEDLRNLLSGKPTSAGTDHDWYRQGSELLKQGKPGRAAICFAKALAWRPHFTKGYHELGVALARQRRRRAAIDCFQKVLRRDRDSADAHGNLGLAYLHEGKADQAVAHLERSLALRPDSAETLNNLGAAWDCLGNLNKAFECFENAVAIKDDYAPAQTNLARTRQRLSGAGQSS